jgi:hypothetical protein
MAKGGGMMHSVIIYLPHLLAFAGFATLLGGIAAVQQVRDCLLLPRLCCLHPGQGGLSTSKQGKFRGSLWQKRIGSVVVGRDGALGGNSGHAANSCCAFC